MKTGMKFEIFKLPPPNMMCMRCGLKVVGQAGSGLDSQFSLKISWAHIIRFRPDIFASKNKSSIFRPYLQVNNNKEGLAFPIPHSELNE